MSNHSSIQRLPREVDPFRLVEQGRKFEARIPVSDFPRIHELLLNDKNSIVNVQLQFARNEYELPVILGNLQTTLEMTCNRCLESTQVLVESEFHVVLVTSDERADELQSGFDTHLVEDQKLILNEFIEDELLLALPIVISHEDCEPKRKLIEALPEDEQDLEGQEKDNPFAVLKDIKLN